MAGAGALVRSGPGAGQDGNNGRDGLDGRDGHRKARNARSVARRPSLPGSRALVGGLLVAVAAVGLYSAYTGSEPGPSHTYVVAAEALPAGSRLEAADLALAAIELPEALAVRAFTDAGALVGATLIAPLAAGELVQGSAVVAKASGPRARELTFTVSRDALPSSLEHGERVDILATYGSGNEAVSVAIATNVLLVALEPGRGRLGDESTATLTFAIDEPATSLSVTHAVAVAKVAVVRATGAPPLAAGTTYPARPPAKP